MLTRLEISGFKNLFEVNIDFGPYTCIAGPNAVGKSNLFDAIEFLSLIADHTFLESAQLLRSAGERLGDPRTLFWYDGSGEAQSLRLAVEMVVSPEAYDDFGQMAKPTSTFLRYEVELAYVTPVPSAPVQIGGVRLVKEDLSYITQTEARSRLTWAPAAFRNAIVQNSRRGTGYISTVVEGDSTTFQVHQDGGSRGQPRRSSVAPRTVLSTVNTADDPTILAARREMQQWRKLSLEPTAMRAPDPVTGISTIGSDGSHLAAALFRLGTSESDGDAFASVAAAASALTDVRAVGVDFDPKRDLLTLEARLGNGPFMPARALSDGTLRFLALSIIEADAAFGGVICMEEPENGIHPAKVGAMVDLLRELAVDVTAPPGADNPLRQVIVNTHSPRFVALQDPDDMLLALPKSLLVDGREARSVELLPMWDSWRATDSGRGVSAALIADYLTQSDDAPMMLDYPGRRIETLD